jgi:hypothetical protein
VHYVTECEVNGVNQLSIECSWIDLLQLS